ncbi:MAG: hypothetical protein ACYTGB_18480, partial [Planctomycetota bacterium]
MRRTGSICAVLSLLVGCAAGRAGEGGAPSVRAERPRIWFRAKAWSGPSVEKLREWMKTDEYKLRARKLEREHAGTIAQAVLYLSGDEAAGKRAVERFKKFTIKGSSPSYSGIEAQKCAAVYDWLRAHPDFDEDSRKAKVAHMEQWADKYMAYLKGGGPTPFYSRISGAIAGLTVMGLALHGDSPKAEGYVRYAHYYLREKIGTIREMEDGATGGGTYGYSHEFTDLANMVAAWRSASDWDAAKWIAEHQGDWLRRQAKFQMWTTYPDSHIVKEGDLWDGAMQDNNQYRNHIDAIAGMYDDGLIRSWALDMARRWPKSKWDDIPWDYHTTYAWQFFVFNSPELKAEPLEKLGRGDVFSPKLHGYVCWRSSWKDDAAHVFFRCGETVDHHGTWDQGKFMIFKHAPLAIKNGAYTGGYMGKMHRYFKSPWSANCVVFSGEKFGGWQPRIDFDGTPSWKEWKAARDRRYKRPPTGVLLAHEVKEEYARALGDLSGSCKGGSTWKREMVFLGYKYVLVLDRVKAAAGQKHRWLLHSITPPEVEGSLVTIENGKGRLFCKTLLPEKHVLADNSGPGKEFLHLGETGGERTLKYAKFLPPKAKPSWRMGQGRVDVTPAADSPECVYLHVL